MNFEFFLRKVFFFQIVLFATAIILNVSSVNGQTKNIDIGDVTGLPLPRFVSVKSNKVNVRRGPNATYQIDWVYTRAGIPLKVIAEYGNWRKVEDFQGEGGWVHSRLLSGKKFIIVLIEGATLRRKPNRKAPAVATIEKGVIARLISITGEWSEISMNSYSGWVRNDSIWGATFKN